MALTKEQREQRKDGLFSSDIARIMTGQSVTVALEKLGSNQSGEQFEPENLDEVQEIQLGQLTEPYILDAYKQKYGIELETSPEFVHPYYEWMGSHPDSAVLPSKKVIVEAKTIGVYNISEWGNPGTDQVNFYTLWQSVCHMACADADRVDVVACFMTLEATKYLLLQKPPPIHVFHINRDLEAEEMMVRKSRFVHDCIAAGITPPPENLDDAKLIWSKASSIEVQATDEIVAVYNDLKKLKAQLEPLTAAKSAAELELKKFMGNAGTLRWQNQILATWKNNKDGVKLNKEKLEQQYEEVYKDCLEPKTGDRRFLLKELKHNH